MINVFDTNTIKTFRFYSLDSFPSFWNNINSMIDMNQIISTREVLREIRANENHPDLLNWVNQNNSIFLTPEADETEFVNEIFSFKHFEGLVDAKKQLRGGYCADPFIIALAKVKNGRVITQEVKKPNRPDIPNVCDKYNIEWMNLDEFMKINNWIF